MTGSPIKTLLCAALLFSFCTAAQADAVVRPAPNFGIDGMPKPTSLRSFRGQAVVLVITQSARGKQFRAQVQRLKQMYGQFATQKVLFVAAIENGPADVPSDIPFVTATNPAQVAADYGVTGRFGIAVIGIDGNLDMITNKIIAAERVRDVIYNNFESQQATRKQPGS